MKNGLLITTMLALTFFVAGVANAQNSPDSNVNLALLGDAVLSGSVTNDGRGEPSHILYDPSTGDYAVGSQWNEYGEDIFINLGTPIAEEGFFWQVDWSSEKLINYITFAGTYSNQPQPNTMWRISYLNNGNWIVIDEGQGGWIDSGIYEWDVTDGQPITASAVRVQLFSDGQNNLVSIHLRGRGGTSFGTNDSGTTPKATLIQLLPYNAVDLGQNLAINKTTIQSSTYAIEHSGIAVDGNNDGNTYTHTQRDEDGFWRVDLGSTYTIGAIKVYNRNDSNQSVHDRLIGFKLYIGNTNSTDPNDYSEIATLNGDPEQTFQNLNVSGRYVMVHGENLNEFLSLAEVEVYELGNSSISVTSITVSPNTISIAAGETSNLNTTIYPVNATNQNVTWTSSNNVVASVSPEGIVTANTVGIATITVTSEGGHTDSTTVTVTESGTNNGGSSGTSVWTESNAIASYDGKVQVGNIAVPGDYKMAIDGKLITEEVRVELSGTWPDYVFTKDHDLPTLEEIQKYIQEKGHLPHMPSAKEVEAHGIALGEMNRLLLEKIEELTLHVIQLKKEINQLNKKK